MRKRAFIMFAITWGGYWRSLKLSCWLSAELLPENRPIQILVNFDPKGAFDVFTVNNLLLFTATCQILTSFESTCWGEHVDIISSVSGLSFCMLRVVLCYKETQTAKKVAKSRPFGASLWLVRFDPHINETCLYKPRFFVVQHHKSYEPGGALFFWRAVSSFLTICRCFQLFFSQQHHSSVLFRTISCVREYCCPTNVVIFCFNCSFKNNSLAFLLHRVLAFADPFSFR